jgi:uncharacterized glyoxalase superfamily protein PhnB
VGREILRVRSQPVDRPWGRHNAAFVDPDGHVWQFGSDIPEN